MHAFRIVFVTQSQRARARRLVGLLFSFGLTVVFLSSFLLTAAPLPARAAGTVYYVDYESGSDAANGTSPATAWQHAPGDPAANGTPAATALAAGDTVQFKGGVRYRGSITIKQSGAAGAPITYKGTGWGTGKAVMDGSEPLRDAWTRCSSAAACGNNPHWQNVYYSDVNRPLTVFTPLYENGEFLWFAQDPNPSDPFWYDDLSTYRRIPQGSTTVKYTATSLTDPAYFTQSEGSAWDGAYLAVWRQPNYVSVTPVTDYDPTTHTITFNALEGAPYTDRDAYYAVINAPRHIDRAGEYAFDAGNGRVYLWPRNPAALAEGTVDVGTRKVGFNVAGHDHITIEGFEIEKYFGDVNQAYNGVGIFNEIATAEHLAIRNNDLTRLRSMKGHGAISLSYVNDVAIEGNTIAENQKSSGLLIQSSSNNVRIDNNTVRKVGYVGIWLNGSVSNSAVTNNRVSEIYGVHANGITAYLGYSNILIAGNTVTDSQFPLTFHGTNTGPLTIYNNIFIASGQESFAANSWGKSLRNVRILNNIFLGGRVGGLNMNVDDQEVVVKNNIMNGLGLSGATSIPAAWDISHNVYTGLAWNQEAVYGWQFREGEFMETDSSTLFTAPASGDYTAAPASPARDRGVAVEEWLALSTPAAADTAPDIGLAGTAVAINESEPVSSVALPVERETVSTELPFPETTSGGGGGAGTMPAHSPTTPAAHAPDTPDDAVTNAHATAVAEAVGRHSAAVTADTAAPLRAEAEALVTHTAVVPLSDAESSVYERITYNRWNGAATTVRRWLAQFIHAGTPTTRLLGAGERAGVVNSFYAAFGKLPTTEEDWQDVIKIANGRWPAQVNDAAETEATAQFERIYRRAPDRKNAHDDAAVTIMAYGLRPALRNTDSERAAIRSFRAIFRKDPTSAVDWDTVRAIAYSGATR